jgi:B12-binding domain/radical SAM domain protein
MPIRAVAVSAPDWPEGRKNAQALNSLDPVSLFNACRYAAARAQDRTGMWSKSNWAVDRRALRDRLLLMYSLDDMPAFDELLRRERPNLLLIGAMTLCMPGAIACAKRAKQILGDNVLVVLGGRHVNETIYLDSRFVRDNAAVQHHVGSPLRLMATAAIPHVFDAVVSGDGEYVIAELGELVAAAEDTPTGDPAARLLRTLNPQSPGGWIVGWTEEDRVQTVVSDGVPINYANLPSPSQMFGVSTAFDCFGGRMTAHVFSDIGRGCVYDCNFCSERASVSGGIRDLDNSADRLYRQLKEAHDVISEDCPDRGASAFVEDSVMLGGKPKLIAHLCEKLERHPIDIVFGAQFTIDQILSRQLELTRLRQVGLTYVFVGVETLTPSEIGGMSKDLGRKKASWLSRIQQTLAFLRSINIQCGCALLFGLGEPHESRIHLLKILSDLRREFGAPKPISLNWAVQHPLCGQDGGAGYDYINWGTPPGEYLTYFHRFGEASLNYPLRHVSPPRLSELRDIELLVDALNRDWASGELSMA